jgi:hypothetical protein
MQFLIDEREFIITEPSNIDFSTHESSEFLRSMYNLLYSRLREDEGLFQIDFDEIDKDLISTIISNDNPRLSLRKLNGAKISSSEWNKNPIQKAFVLFFSIYPDFNLFIKNIHADADINILNAENLFGEITSTNNFLNIKRKIDELNNLNWSREKDTSERQAGVSILGNMSETLLATAMETLIDNQNFFRSQNHDVQSYGDFVLMCLPNNLWISVKSNFARERLLASGYTTDIIGVGYFTDSAEFTSQTKIRNFIKVGFLAMYIPNIPITEEQLNQNISTYEEVIQFYENTNRALPKNINGQNFLRPLSQLYNDLNSLLEIEDIKRRTTVKY